MSYWFWKGGKDTSTETFLRFRQRSRSNRQTTAGLWNSANFLTLEFTSEERLTGTVRYLGVCPS